MACMKLKSERRIVFIRNKGKNGILYSVIGPYFYTFLRRQALEESILMDLATFYNFLGKNKVIHKLNTLIYK